MTGLNRTRSLLRRDAMFGLIAAIAVVFASAAAAQTTISGTSTQVTTDPASQVDPAISGDIVVFTDSRNGDEDIYYVDLSDMSEHRVTSNPANQELHDVSGGRTVYTDTQVAVDGIRVFDISSNSDTILTSGGQQTPTIDGNLVVFEDFSGSNTENFLADLGAGTTQQITSTNEDECNAVVGSGYIVFERQNGSAWDVILHVFASGLETNLGPGGQPHTDGVTVVYDAIGNGQDIFHYDIATGA